MEPKAMEMWFKWFSFSNWVGFLGEPAVNFPMCTFIYPFFSQQLEKLICSTFIFSTILANDLKNPGLLIFSTILLHNPFQDVKSSQQSSYLHDPSWHSDHGLLLVWVGGLDFVGSPKMKGDCYLRVPDSNPTPLGPKPTKLIISFGHQPWK